MLLEKTIMLMRLVFVYLAFNYLFFWSIRFKIFFFYNVILLFAIIFVYVDFKFLGATEFLIT